MLCKGCISFLYWQVPAGEAMMPCVVLSVRFLSHISHSHISHSHISQSHAGSVLLYGGHADRKAS